MRSSTKDQAEIKFHKVKGKVKEIAEELTDNPELETEGSAEKIAGKVQEKIGEVKKVGRSSESTEEIKTDIDIQRVKGRKLSWVQQSLSF